MLSDGAPCKSRVCKAGYISQLLHHIPACVLLCDATHQMQSVVDHKPWVVHLAEMVMA